MFYEYAIEPAALSSWDRVRFFLDALGPWRGRFLAEYPRKWRKMIYESLNCPDVEKSRIEERLRRLDRRVFSARSNSPYDQAKSWRENALTVHQHTPFRAIVAVGEGSGEVLDASLVDEGCDLWRVESGQLVSRDATIFKDRLLLLLRASSRIILIDPYFRADQADKTEPLVQFCKAIASLSATIEVHFSDEPRGYQPCIQDAARALPRLLPVGSKVTLHCWRERTGGPRLHNRYVITNIGGVKFGDGIEAGAPGQQDHISILDEPSRAELWSQYAGSSPGFDAVGSPQVYLGTDARGRR